MSDASAAESFEFHVRTAVPKDTSFIFATWLRCYKKSSYFAKKIEHAVFFSRHHKVVEEILARPTAKVLVATPAGDPETIIGYLVIEITGGLPIIHFAYTKNVFRRIGVMTTLLKASAIDPANSIFTHWTYDADHLIPKWPGIQFDPYLA